jgi:hypothetical protein
VRAGSSRRHVERVRQVLLRRGMPRVQMSLILAATGAAGFVASFAMLRLGLSLMWLRYALAVLLAYAVFLLLLRLWLLLHSREPLPDLPDFDLINPNLNLSDLNAGPTSFGGSGDFGGGGAGGSWSSAGEGLGRVSTPSGAGGGGGSGGGGGGSGLLDSLSFDVDDEGCVFFLLALALIVAGTLAALYVVYAAPLLLAEILVEGVLLSGLYRGMKKARRAGGDWLRVALRRTWLPVLLTLVTFSAAGYLLQRAAPRARSIGEAWRMVTSD